MEIIVSIIIVFAFISSILIIGNISNRDENKEDSKYAHLSGVNYRRMRFNYCFKPLRGTKKAAEELLSGETVLKYGEVFFEVPDTGVGTGAGKIKMGDGVHDYADLPYFLE